MSDYQIGDAVVFEDEFGKKRVGRIGSTSVDAMPGHVAIDGTYGSYVRHVRDIRPAEHWEAHTAAFNEGVI